MNAPLNISSLATDRHFRADPAQLSKDLQDKLKREAQQAVDTEKSLAQLLNLEYTTNGSLASPGSSLPTNTVNANLLKNDFISSSIAARQDPSSIVAGVRTDVLNRLLFSAPIGSVSTADAMGLAGTAAAAAKRPSAYDLCQQALHELQSVNANASANAAPSLEGSAAGANAPLSCPQQQQENVGFSALEPSPINEKKMTVMQHTAAHDANAMQLWRQQQQQQQMQSLLGMAYFPAAAAAAAAGGFHHPTANPALALTSFMAAEASNDATAKRGLGLPATLLDRDVLRPSKKQRGVVLSPSGAKHAPPVPPIVEDSISQSGRFRDYQSCQWSVRFNELLEFRKENGHCCVPHGYNKNPILARWVKRQRYQYKQRAEGKPSTMTIERINVLERYGFVWDSHGAAWMERFNEIKEYSLKHGNCNVSSSYISCHGSQLSSWVKCQRRQYKMFKENLACNMTKERISKLEGIGFEWELRRCRNSRSSKKNDSPSSSSSTASQNSSSSKRESPSTVVGASATTLQPI